MLSWYCVQFQLNNCVTEKVSWTLYNQVKLTAGERPSAADKPKCEYWKKGAIYASQIK